MTDVRMTGARTQWAGRKVAVATVAALVLVGCSTVESASRTTRVAATDVHDAVVYADAPRDVHSIGEVRNVGEAVMTPARDLGIRRSEIPPTLLAIDNPYGHTPPTCGEVRAELAELNALLGTDHDEERVEEGGKHEKTGLRVMASAVGGLVPFRGLVREVSGAKARERELKAAYRKGEVRRGYLRGVEAARECG